MAKVKDCPGFETFGADIKDVYKRQVGKFRFIQYRFNTIKGSVHNG